MLAFLFRLLAFATFLFPTVLVVVSPRLGTGPARTLPFRLAPRMLALLLRLVADRMVVRKRISEEYWGTRKKTDTGP